MSERNEIVDLLVSLGQALGAVFVQVQPGFGPVDWTLGWADDNSAKSRKRYTKVVRLGQRHLASQEQEELASSVVVYRCGDLEAAVTGIYGRALQDDVLIVARPQTRPYEEREIGMISAYARLIPVAMERAGVGSPLDDLVTHVATTLMSVTGSSLPSTLQQVVRTLAEFFEVSTAFMRRNDHTLGASILVAEWPKREDVPDPDPIGVVPFEGSDTDPVFAAIRDLRETMVIRPQDEDEYQQRVREASGGPAVALAMVPILREATTLGVLGFVNFGDRAWSKAELNALRAIAALLAQLEARVEAEERLEQRAYHDELTGLLNRRALREALRVRLNSDPDPAAPPEKVAVVFADLDRLKALNDSLGHATGDAVLQEIANRLSRQMGPGDLVGRLGGDEFVFIFGTCPDDPLAATTKIVHEVTAARFDVGQSSMSTTTMCAGIAIGEPNAITAEELLHRADVALIEAKGTGLGHVLLFDDGMLATSQTRGEVRRHLRHAVADEALELYYLPEVDLRTGALAAVEALVRWHHPKLGLLLPNSFIPLAEESPQAMLEIGEWILNRACAQLAAWRHEFPERSFTLRINVSPAELMLGNIAKMVASVLSAHGLQGRDLCLEVTERAVLRQMDQVVTALEELRQSGVTVALDDFGTGYSTLTQLRWLPVDTLKVDRQFITELASNPADLVIVQSTVLLAKAFGLDVVAEGVDSIVAVRELLRMGCYLAEGHLIHAAAPAQVIRNLVAAGGVDLEQLGVGSQAD